MNRILISEYLCSGYIYGSNTDDGLTSFIRRGRDFFFFSVKRITRSSRDAELIFLLQHTFRTLFGERRKKKVDQSDSPRAQRAGVNVNAGRSSKPPHFCGTRVHGSITRAHFCKCQCARRSKVGQGMAGSMPHEIPQWYNTGSFNYH